MRAPPLRLLLVLLVWLGGLRAVIADDFGGGPRFNDAGQPDPAGRPLAEWEQLLTEKLFTRDVDPEGYRAVSATMAAIPKPPQHELLRYLGASEFFLQRYALTYLREPQPLSDDDIQALAHVLDQVASQPTPPTDRWVMAPARALTLLAPLPTARAAPALPALRLLASTKPAPLRRLATLLLFRWDPSTRAPVLERLLDHPREMLTVDTSDPASEFQLSDTLRAAGINPADLCRRILNGDRSSTDRCAALNLAYGSANDPSTDVLLEALDDPDAAVRQAAANLLGFDGGRTGEPTTCARAALTFAAASLLLDNTPAVAAACNGQRGLGVTWLLPGRLATTAATDLAARNTSPGPALTRAWLESQPNPGLPVGATWRQLLTTTADAAAWLPAVVCLECVDASDRAAYEDWLAHGDPPRQAIALTVLCSAGYDTPARWAQLATLSASPTLAVRQLARLGPTLSAARVSSWRPRAMDGMRARANFDLLARYQEQLAAGPPPSALPAFMPTPPTYEDAGASVTADLQRCLTPPNGGLKDLRQLLHHLLSSHYVYAAQPRLGFVVPELQHQLESTIMADAATAMLAAARLGETGAPLLPAVLAAHQRQPRQTAWAFIAAAAEWGPTARPLLPQLDTLAATPGEDYQEAIAWARRLIDPAAALAAERALAGQPPAALVAALAAPDAGQRYAARQLLAAPPADPQWRQDAVAALIPLARPTERYAPPAQLAARHAAVLLLAAYGEQAAPAVEPLLQLAGQPAAPTAWLALSTLAQLAPTRAAPYLDLLLNPPPATAAAPPDATFAAQRRGLAPVLLPACQARLQSPSEANRLSAIPCLRELATAPAIALLVTTLKDPASPVCNAAARALADLGEPARAPLLAAAQGPDPQLAPIATRVLARPPFATPTP